MTTTKGDKKNVYGDGAAWMRGPLLGKGSFGRVYKATANNTNRTGFPSVMAVKSAKLSHSGTLQNEKEIMTNVNASPYVITCFGDETTVGKGGVKAYNLLLEYASGGTLSDMIKKSGGKGLLEHEVREHTRSILRGLDHIHSLGYVHCDLKPDNILLVPNGDETTEFTAKISDFGLAKPGKQHRDKKRRLMEGQWRGTPMYLSPEAVICNEQEAESDIWAVGCVVLKMLTGGKAVWEGRNTEDVLKKIGTDQESPRIPEGISGDLRHFLGCCFERNPVLRLTADVLLEHPFVNGSGNGDICNCSGDDVIMELVEVWEVSSSSSSGDEVVVISSSNDVAVGVGKYFENSCFSHRECPRELRERGV